MKEPGRRLARVALVLLVATAVGLVHGGDRYRTGRPVFVGQPFGWWAVTWPYLLRAWVWAGLFPAATALWRRWPLSTAARSARARSVAAHLAGGLLLTLASLVLNYTLAVLVVEGRLVAGDLGRPLLRAIVVGWRYHLIAYGLVVSVAVGIETARGARAAALRDAELRARLAAARLETLRAQLHPHFLFNTLNGVLPLIEDDPEAAVRAVGELAALFRESLVDGASISDVAGEVRFLERYLGLLKLRFGERLDYSLTVAPGAESARVPRLLLQPLVENAVQHGLGPKAEGGRVEVEARREKDLLVLEVRDDGSGLARDPAGSPGVGLANTRARLLALHGDRQSVSVGPRAGGGVVARIEMPFEAAA